MGSFVFGVLFEVAFVLFGPMSGKLSDKYATRLFSTLGLTISSVGFFCLTQVNLATNYPSFLRGPEKAKGSR